MGFLNKQAVARPEYPKTVTIRIHVINRSAEQRDGYGFHNDSDWYDHRAVVRSPQERDEIFRKAGDLIEKNTEVWNAARTGGQVVLQIGLSHDDRISVTKTERLRMYVEI